MNAPNSAYTCQAYTVVLATSIIWQQAKLLSYNAMVLLLLLELHWNFIISHSAKKIISDPNLSTFFLLIKIIEFILLFRNLALGRNQLLQVLWDAEVVDGVLELLDHLGNDLGDVEALEPPGHVREEVEVLLGAVADVAVVARTCISEISFRYSFCVVLAWHTPQLDLWTPALY